MENKEKRERDSHEASYYKKLTLPNIITGFRILASLGLCGYIARFGITSPLAITLATLGIGATDALDGFLARNCGMSSQLGSVLDPIADKIYNWGIGITLMATGIMPLWPLLISVRDLAVAGVTSYQFEKYGKEMPPTKPAKLKMVFQSIGLISTLAFGFGGEGLGLIAPVCMASAIATVLPEIYCIRKKYFSDKKEEDKEEELPSNTILVEEKEEEKVQEKSKTLEYNSLTTEYVNDKPKVKKKTLFK